MTFIVGLTGGIGSGKTTAANFFAGCGAPIIDADLLAREVISPGTAAYQAVIQQFGKEVLQSNGELSRAQLRQIIFTDFAQKKWLETLLHPLIYQQIRKKISHLDYPYCIIVIPLLAEQLHRFGDIIDYILVIEAPLSMRLERIIRRDRCNPAAVQMIVQQQATSEERQQIAHAIILNDGSTNALEEKIHKFHQTFLKGIYPTPL